MWNNTLTNLLFPVVYHVNSNCCIPSSIFFFYLYYVMCDAWPRSVNQNRVSVARAGSPIIQGLAVQIPIPPSPLCLWARRLTSNCSQWGGRILAWQQPPLECKCVSERFQQNTLECTFVAPRSALQKHEPRGVAVEVHCGAPYLWLQLQADCGSLRGVVVGSAAGRCRHQVSATTWGECDAPHLRCC